MVEYKEISFIGRFLGLYNEEKQSVEYKKVLVKETTMIESLDAFGFMAGKKENLPIMQHTHKDNIEITIMVDGIQKFFVEHEYTLYKGEALFVYENELHCAGDRVTENCALIWIHINMRSYGNFLNLPPHLSEQAKAMLRNLGARKLKLNTKLINRFYQSFELLMQNDYLQHIKGYTLFCHCMMELCEMPQAIEQLTHDVALAKEYIVNNIKEPIYTNELCKLSGVDIRTLREDFLQQLLMSPSDYIYYEKALHSKSQLINTDDNLIDISYEYHFNNYMHYKKSFKNATGVTPRKYRKNAKKKRSQTDERVNK